MIVAFHMRKIYSINQPVPLLYQLSIVYYWYCPVKKSIFTSRELDHGRWQIYISNVQTLFKLSTSMTFIRFTTAYLNQQNVQKKPHKVKTLQNYLHNQLQRLLIYFPLQQNSFLLRICVFLMVPFLWTSFFSNICRKVCINLCINLYTNL